MMIGVFIQSLLMLFLQQTEDRRRREHQIGPSVIIIVTMDITDQPRKRPR